jgi:hypothetical protein
MNSLNIIYILLMKRRFLGAVIVALKKASWIQ